MKDKKYLVVAYFGLIYLAAFFLISLLAPNPNAHVYAFLIAIGLTYLVYLIVRDHDRILGFINEEEMKIVEIEKKLMRVTGLYNQKKKEKQLKARKEAKIAKSRTKKKKMNGKKIVKKKK